MQIAPHQSGTGPAQQDRSPQERERVEAQAARIVSKARADLIMSQPFFGTLALKLRVAADWSQPTFAVDGVTMFYNPDFVMSLPFKQVVAVVAHEVMHCALAHHTRMRDRDGATWNRAGDYAINPLLEASGFELPDDALNDPAYAGKSADEIYRMIYVPKPPGGGGGGKDQSSPQGGGQGGGQGQNGGPGPDQGQSLSTGTVNQPANGVSEAAMAEQRMEWEAATAQAAQAARAAGKLPGHLEELLKDLSQPVVDWREVLRDFISRIAKNDYSWKKPNRRFVGQGLYLPSAYSEDAGPIGIVVDTSASVRAHELAAFVSEINSIIGDVKPEKVRVLQCDTRVHRDDTYDPEFDEVRMKVKGRGGTDMVPAFERLAEDPDGYECIICLTDMMIPHWPEEPACPVLWVETGGEGRPPPYGEVIPLTVDPPKGH